MDALELRKKVILSLRKQGFRMRQDKILPPADLNKDKTRLLHEIAVEHKRERAKDSLGRKENQLLSRIASGHEVIPAKIKPRLIEVLPDSENELLFRYASLHWSIPISSGYGKRMRFIVIDDDA